MKSKKKKILFIENVEADMRLAVSELQKEIKDFSWVMVKTRENFVEQLQDFNPDIVICNNSVPGFSGLKALKTTLETVRNLPVVVLAETSNEEMAVAFIQAGAADYVLKNNIQTLPKTVKEIMAQGEMRHG